MKPDKKKRKVTQVLWVCEDYISDYGTGAHRPEVWLDIARDNVIEQDLKHFRKARALVSKQWHKVPTCTRVIEEQ